MRVAGSPRLIVSIAIRVIMAAAFVLWPLPAPASGSSPLTLPTGFVDELAVGGLLAPRDFVFTPDGRILIVERGNSAGSLDINFASVRVFKNGMLLPAYALNLNVCGDGERGLLGITLDPNFSANGYVYLYYTRQKQAGGAPCLYNTYTNGVDGPRNVVSRFTMAGDVIDPASERVLINNIATDSGIHNAGDLQFGADGYLYVTVGDSNIVPSPAQFITNLNGKILRILPTPGLAGGYTTADNPFDGNPNAWYCGTNLPGTSKPCREVYAYGFRNPFRFTIRPGTSTAFAADVGGGAWEEISQVQAGGDHGYPAREGPCEPGVICTLPQPPSGYVDPIYAYPHTVLNQSYDSAIIGGDFYTGATFPAEYADNLFFADFVLGWIRRLKFEAGTGQWTAYDFASGGAGIIGVVAGPDDALYYLTFISDVARDSELRRISYQPDINQTPAAALSAAPQSGPQDTLFTFSAYGSFDPDGDIPLAYQWNLGDGTLISSTAAMTVTHTYVGAGPKVVSLTVHDSGVPPAASLPVSMTVFPGHTAPTGTLVLTNTTEPGRALYYAGDTWQFGVANVASEGPLAAEPYAWEVVFHHRMHTHPFLSGLTGPTGEFFIPTLGETDPDVWYRVRLGITDAQGLTTHTYSNVDPATATLDVFTSPAGGGVLVDNQTFTTPVSLTRVISITLGLEALSPQTLDGAQYLFASWSDGGARAHAISVPVGGGAYTANLVPMVSPHTVYLPIVLGGP